MRRFAALRSTAVLVVLLGAIAPACDGGSTTTPSASGIDSQKLVRDLTDAEIRTLCDWSAAANGGYGRVTTCDAGITRHAAKDQQSCVDGVSQTASCTAKVQDVEVCAQKTSVDPCNVAVAFLAPECQAVLTCGTT